MTWGTPRSFSVEVLASDQGLLLGGMIAQWGVCVCVCLYVYLCAHRWTVSGQCACCEAENLHAALRVLAWVSVGWSAEAEGYGSLCTTREDVVRTQETALGCG